MSDTKKYSIIEYTALVASALLTFLFSCAYRYDKIILSIAPIMLNGICLFASAFFAKKQTGKTDKAAITYGAGYSITYVTLLCLLVYFSKKNFSDYITPDTSFYCVSAISMIFILTAHSSWRKAYKKIMNKKPVPLIPLLSVLLATGMAMIPVNIIKEVIPIPEKHNLPIPYTDGFMRTSPVIRENTIKYYVSEKNGDDSNSGLSEEEALKTINAVKTLIKQEGSAENGVVVYIRNGSYDRNSFIFSEDDSGTEEQDIIYIAEKGVIPTDEDFNVNFTEKVSHITLFGLELTQNATISIDGNYISLSGCSFNGCPVTVNGNNNIITGNEFSMTNSAAITDNGIANNIIYNYFHDISVLTDGAVIINGSDTEVCGNCFDKIAERTACSCIYISDDAYGIKIDGNLLLNLPGNAVSHSDNENIFNSFSGNFILNCDAPVINNRNGTRISLKFNNNILITSERADHYPLNAVYTFDALNDIFTDPEKGEYKLKSGSVISEAFPMIKDIILTAASEDENVPPEIITLPDDSTTIADETSSVNAEESTSAGYVITTVQDTTVEDIYG